MWLFAKLAVALGLYVFRRQRKAIVPIGDGPYFVHQTKRKNEVVFTRFGIPFVTSVRFHLLREDRSDRLAKWFRLASEFQTRDAEFDRRVYVLGDHPFLHRLLGQTLAARAAVLSLLTDAVAIESDGRTLWVLFKGELDSHPLLPELTALSAALAPLQGAVPSRWKDPFERTAILIEAFLWGAAGYAAASAMEFSATRMIHLDGSAALRLGLLYFAVLFAVGLAATFLLLADSSRSHRIWRDALFTLLFAGPFVGWGVVHDINCTLDRTVAEVRSATITGRHERRGRRGRRYYYLYLDTRSPSSDEGAKGTLPRVVEVSPSMYGNAANAGRFEAGVSPGRLGLEWFRWMRVR